MTEQIIITDCQSMVDNWDYIQKNYWEAAIRGQVKTQIKDAYKANVHHPIVKVLVQLACKLDSWIKADIDKGRIKYE